VTHLNLSLINYSKMKRTQTLQPYQTEGQQLLLTQEISDCFEYNGAQVCVQDLVKLEDL
jgi:hypothetical protein